MLTTDFLVIGGGVIGISIAREIKRSYPDTVVTLIEKEQDCGLHASGRNSGVLHAGFYYSADSLKAKFTRQGNILLTEYCEDRHLKINKCGKLVVAQCEEELDSLQELLRRGANNGVPLQDISLEEARAIEPRVVTYQKAIYSPTTASVDPREVMDALKKDALCEGIKIKAGIRYLGKKTDKINSSDGTYQAGYVINAGGLYADRIAMDFGFSEGYRILPFKGIYLYSNEKPFSIRTNIYPVPNLKNPFLGVHYTLTVDGRIKIGPTAIPVLWREQYSGLGNFSAKEFADISVRQLLLLLRSKFDFKKLAVEELRKYSRKRLVKLASSMVEGINESDYRVWGVPGIRAQLVNNKTNALEMDFVIQGDEKSMHVLNAVSPAFTCSIPFSKFVCRKIDSLLH